MSRQHLLESIAATIGNYRKGEIPALDADHVDCWIRQFDSAVQEPMLAEMDHVLKQSYLSREYVLSFLRGVARMRRLAAYPGVWQWLTIALARFAGRGIDGKAYPCFGEMSNSLKFRSTAPASARCCACSKTCSARNTGRMPFGRARRPVPLPGRHPVYRQPCARGRWRMDSDGRAAACRPRGDRDRLLPVRLRAHPHKDSGSGSQRRKRIGLHWLRAMEFEDRRRAPARGTASNRLFFRTFPSLTLMRGRWERLGFPSGSGHRHPRVSAVSFPPKRGAICLNNSSCLPGSKSAPFTENRRKFCGHSVTIGTRVWALAPPS